MRWMRLGLGSNTMDHWGLDGGLLRLWVSVWVGQWLLVAGCASGTAQPPDDRRAQLAPMSLHSSAFEPHGELPSRHTCEGEGSSPPLTWDHLPSGTQALALQMQAPDVPDPRTPRRTRVHWLLFDIPVLASGLPAGADPLPVGARDGLNDWQQPGYHSPCPERGRQRYVFKLTALDEPLGLERPDLKALEAAMVGHVLARAELVGTYRKRVQKPQDVARTDGSGTR